MTTTTYGFEAGEIRRATVVYRLADGSRVELPQRVMLLDVQPADPAEQGRLWDQGQPTRVLWQFADDEGLPIEEPRWDLVGGNGFGVGEGAVRIAALYEPVGQYEPRDPRLNSLEILREHAAARASLRALLRALAALPPAERARLSRLLGDGKTARAVGEVGDAAVYELTRQPGQTHASVAELLGVSPAAVNKAIKRHRARLGLTRRRPTDEDSRA